MKMLPTRFSVLLVTLSLFSLSALAQAPLRSGVFGSMEARSLGPATSSGRVTAIEACYTHSETGGTSDRRLCIYVGSAAGGIFKSKDNGTTFKAIFDKERELSIGAMALDPNHHDSVLWVGTGESNCRNSVGIGGGLYKTTDGGEKFKLLGFEKVERIAKIAMHHSNTDVVFVAALGALWGDSKERGLYRTRDGGKTFEQVLYVDEKTGCADVTIDPDNPSIVYATMWQFRRTAYSFNSGGPGSALYKSVDGGSTWTKLTKDMPSGDLGRILVTVAPSKPNVVYAMIESKESALYRSDDRGDSWKKMSTALSVTARPFYFSCLYVDPFNENRVYRPSFQLGISDDGGKTFNGFQYGGGAHPDLHALWIDPTNPQHLLLGTDGGVYRSYDRGGTWTKFRNLSLAQFYHVSYDFEEPYNIFGGLQDNGSWMVSHRIQGGGIQNRNWEATGWGDGFWVIRDRFNKDIIYFESQGGNAVRRHMTTNESKPIKPYENAGEKKLRFNWSTPLTQSPTNPKTIYMASQFLHRSQNQGDTWERISPDLTTNDSTKIHQENSGGVTADNTSAENHCTIIAVAESAMDENIIWVGTDDGNLQFTTNGGKNWTNVASNIPKDLPQGTWVSTVEPGHFNKGTCYVTFDNHTRGDMEPYLFRTDDFGKSWSKLSTDSVRGFAHVIREDLINKRLLFVGTEHGMFVSFDGGQHWAQFKGNLPSTPVRDIQIHPRDNDLIIATHGRGVFILDDITPLRSLTPEAMSNELTFLPTRPTVIRHESGFQEFGGSDEFYGPSPSGDAMITYFLKARHLVGDMKIEILNAQNEVITTLPPGKRKGINRVGWGMNMKPPKVAVSPNTGGGDFGPSVLAGDYTVRITKNDKVFNGKLTLQNDPRSIYNSDGRKKNYETMMKLYAMIERVAFSAEQITSMRDTLKARIFNMKDPDAKSKVREFVSRLDSLHKTIVAKKSTLFADTEPQLREKVADIYGDIAQTVGKPGDEQLKRVATIESMVNDLESTVGSMLKHDLPNVNTVLANSGSTAVSAISHAEFLKRED